MIFLYNIDLYFSEIDAVNLSCKSIKFGDHIIYYLVILN